ncbi:hypothetical protein [uncultured Mediterranean phage uvMED]|nr:hypothetical protein [uncultured Mediterranean phage uvMED]
MSGLIESSADARSKTIGQNFRVRAWVNFNSIGSITIRGSGNVSSITDNNTGDFTVNYATALPNENYAVSSVQSFISNGNGPNATVNVNRINSSGLESAPTTSATRINTSNNAGASSDMKYVNLIVVA